MGTALTILTKESAIPLAYNLEADLKWIDTLSNEDKKAKENELEARKEYVERSISRVKNPHVLFLTALRQGLQRLAQYCLPDPNNPFNIPDTFQSVKPVLSPGWQSLYVNYDIPYRQDWFLKKTDPDMRIWGHLFLPPSYVRASEDPMKTMQWILHHRYITKPDADIEALFCSLLIHDFSYPNRRISEPLLSTIFSLMQGHYVDKKRILKRLLSQPQIHSLTDSILRKWYAECTCDHIVCALKSTNKDMLKKLHQRVNFTQCPLADVIKVIDACTDINDFNIVYSFSGVKKTVVHELLPIIKHFLEELQPIHIDWMFEQDELICSAATQLNECRLWFIRYQAIDQLNALIAYASSEKFQTLMNSTLVSVDKVLPVRAEVHEEGSVQ